MKGKTAFRRFQSQRPTGISITAHSHLQLLLTNEEILPQKLVRLNSVGGAFEFEVDAEGNTHLKIWEWK